MSQYIEKYKKNIVIDMRKRGFSYSEIQNSIHVPKSTIAFWLKDIKLSKEQIEKLKNKRVEIARLNSEKRKTKTRELIEKIKNSSAKDIGRISKRELWLMGIALYWRERLLLNNENDLKKGINFMSSDPYLIKLFLKWLQEVGSVGNDEIIPDIFIKGKKNELCEEAIDYWSEVTGFPREHFTHIYSQKSKPKDGKKKAKFYGLKFGLLRVRVRSSSAIVRQIAGWIRGVQAELNL